MGVYKVTDNAATTLVSAISNSAAVTSLILADASKFPVVNHGGSGSDWSYATLYDAGGNIETVKITRRDSGSNTLTIVRGTAAGITGVTDASCLAWAATTTGVACRLIAQTINDIYASQAQAAASASSAASSASAAATSAAIVELVSGTRVSFAQAAAPTGWTQDTSDAIDNRMLRVVKTAGGGTGGSHSPILMDVVPSHVHSLTIDSTNIDHSHSGNTGGESATHAHFSGVRSTYNSGGGGGVGAEVWLGGGSEVWTGGQSTGHYHGFTSNGMNSNATHTHTGSVGAHAGASNWTPRYVDLILCTKD